MLRLLHETAGPAVGLSALRAWFPDLPRCVLAELLARYRRLWRRRWQQRGWQLDWRRPGAVWAMDFSASPRLIDGRFEVVFAVRDLGSRCQLAWQAVAGERADDVLPVLAALMAEHGPPLVLKSDNGSAFISAALQELLETIGVVPLFSPPRRPQYNGGLERSNGTLKTYTHLHASRCGRGEAWTAADLEAARRLACALPRPWGWQGPSPQEAWDAREPLGDADRSAWAAELRRQRAEVSAELRLADDAPPAAAARCERLAISRALQTQGLLEMRAVRRARPLAKRKRPPPPVAPAARDTNVSVRATPRSIDDDAQERTQAILESAPPSATMTPAPPISSPSTSTPGAAEPVRRGPAVQLWLRRLITPLIQFVKADRFKR